MMINNDWIKDSGGTWHNMANIRTFFVREGGEEYFALSAELDNECHLYFDEEFQTREEAEQFLNDLLLIPVL